jgi:quinol monooxygenase YgiN
MTARFETQPDKLAVCAEAIREFVEYVRANEPDTLLYTSLQDTTRPTHFFHYFIFRDEQVREIHSNSEVVNRFTSVLYPNLVAPVEFTDYELFVTTK